MRQAQWQLPLCALMLSSGWVTGSNATPPATSAKDQLGVAPEKADASRNVAPRSARSARLIPCQLNSFARPQEATVNGCARASCIQSTAGERVCKCLDAGGEDDRFVLERNGVRLGDIPTAAYMGDTGDFQVLRGDVDGRGGEEWIIANRDTTSNGIGVNSWSIHVLRDLEHFSAPLTFSVDDYGAGSFLRPEQGAGCEILATEWDYSGGRMWFVGRRYRYVAGRLVPVAGAPVLRRRYREGFEKQRLIDLDRAAIPHQGAPADWLSVHVEALRIDTLLHGERVKEGRTEPYAVDREVARSEPTCPRFADLRTGRAFPQNYTPDGLEKALAGKRLRFTTFRGGDIGHRICWLEPL